MAYQDILWVVLQVGNPRHYPKSCMLCTSLTAEIELLLGFVFKPKIISSNNRIILICLNCDPQHHIERVDHQHTICESFPLLSSHMSKAKNIDPMKKELILCIQFLQTNLGLLLCNLFTPSDDAIPYLFWSKVQIHQWALQLNLFHDGDKIYPWEC